MSLELLEGKFLKIEGIPYVIYATECRVQAIFGYKIPREVTESYFQDEKHKDPKQAVMITLPGTEKNIVDRAKGDDFIKSVYANRDYHRPPNKYFIKNSREAIKKFNKLVFINIFFRKKMRRLESELKYDQDKYDREMELFNKRFLEHAEKEKKILEKIAERQVLVDFIDKWLEQYYNEE